MDIEKAKERLAIAKDLDYKLCHMASEADYELKAVPFTAEEIADQIIAAEEMCKQVEIHTNAVRDFCRSLLQNDHKNEDVTDENTPDSSLWRQVSGIVQPQPAANDSNSRSIEAATLLSQACTVAHQCRKWLQKLRGVHAITTQRQQDRADTQPQTPQSPDDYWDPPV